MNTSQRTLYPVFTAEPNVLKTFTRAEVTAYFISVVVKKAEITPGSMDFALYPQGPELLKIMDFDMTVTFAQFIANDSSLPEDERVYTLNTISELLPNPESLAQARVSISASTEAELDKLANYLTKRVVLEDMIVSVSAMAMTLQDNIDRFVAENGGVLVVNQGLSIGKFEKLVYAKTRLEHLRKNIEQGADLRLDLLAKIKAFTTI